MSATAPSAASATDAISYDDLYARWERGNWRATELDFSQDVVDWNQKMTPEQRRSAMWLYTLFFHGEASLAQPGQHMIESYLEELDLLPGFREGMRNVALDEQRHIGFGVKLLADLYREDPERIGDAIVDTLREVLPWTAAVAKPPGWDETYMTAFGFTYDDLGEEGARSLEQKLRAIGLPLDSLPGFPMDMTLPPRERARRGRIMLAGNYIGPDRPVARDAETLGVVFDAIAQSANSRAVPGGMTVQWDFTDAEPWHVEVANGSSRAARRAA